MHGSFWASISSAILIASVVGCQSALPHPTLEDGQWATQRWPGTDVATLSRGRELYLAKCGGCHNLYAPDAFGPARWPSLVEGMVENAGINGSERDMIVRYLLTTERRETHQDVAAGQAPSRDIEARSSR